MNKIIYLTSSEDEVVFHLACVKGYRMPKDVITFKYVDTTIFIFIQKL